MLLNGREKKLFPLLRVLHHTYAYFAVVYNYIVFIPAILLRGHPIVTETAIISVLTTYNEMVKKEKRVAFRSICFVQICRDLRITHIYCIVYCIICLCGLNTPRIYLGFHRSLLTNRYY